MEHIRALERFLENADIEEVKFIRGQIKKLSINIDRQIKGENMWKPWTPAEENRLMSLRNSGLEFDVIGVELGRTKYAVSLRYEKIVSRSTQTQNNTPQTE